mmetsp:Transcript_38880/g.90910  ORF Transcript_38880/g.90910 Transcript_38880/m.90910 type:complete len:383 (-) Transcript_38880:212-1360(-)
MIANHCNPSLQLRGTPYACSFLPNFGAACRWQHPWGTMTHVNTSVMPFTAVTKIAPKSCPHRNGWSHRGTSSAKAELPKDAQLHAVMTSVRRRVPSLRCSTPFPKLPLGGVPLVFFRLLALLLRSPPLGDQETLAPHAHLRRSQHAQESRRVDGVLLNIGAACRGLRCRRVSRLDLLAGSKRGERTRNELVAAELVHRLHAIPRASEAERVLSLVIDAHLLLDGHLARQPQRFDNRRELRAPNSAVAVGGQCVQCGQAFGHGAVADEAERADRCGHFHSAICVVGQSHQHPLDGIRLSQLAANRFLKKLKQHRGCRADSGTSASETSRQASNSLGADLVICTQLEQLICVDGHLRVDELLKRILGTARSVLNDKAVDPRADH